MLKLGRRAGDPDIVELLLECHARIRTFVMLARELGERPELPAHEVRLAAGRVRRYFGEALPLHVADEEQSVAPRLRGRTPEIDAALATMVAEHESHEKPLAEMLRICRALEEAPERHAELRIDLATLAASLVADFEDHLALEERVLLPAIRALLTSPQRAEMRAELRRRRGGAATA